MLQTLQTLLYLNSLNLRFSTFEIQFYDRHQPLVHFESVEEIFIDMKDK